MLEIGKTYKDGWGKKYVVVGKSSSNPKHWVTTDPDGVYRAWDGRKCIFHAIQRVWRCPVSPSQWDLDVKSGS